jgi:hypothetical protein
MRFAVRFRRTLFGCKTCHVNVTTGYNTSREDGTKMDSGSIISAIDAEIARLQQVRDLLAKGAGVGAVRRGGRPKKAAAPAPAKKRTLSPDARKRIAEAQKKRWAKTKKLAELSAVGKASERAPNKGAK